MNPSPGEFNFAPLPKEGIDDEVPAPKLDPPAAQPPNPDVGALPDGEVFGGEEKLPNGFVGGGEAEGQGGAPNRGLLLA